MLFFEKKCINICIYQKKAVPLHPLLRNLQSKISNVKCERSSRMVVLAQLVEHRIVVPSVVGSSPTFHPKTAEIPYGIAAVFLCGCAGS